MAQDTMIRREVTAMEAFVEAQQLIGQQNRYDIVRSSSGDNPPFEIAYRFTTEHQFDGEPVAVLETTRNALGIITTREQRLGNWIGELAAVSGRFLDPTSIDRIATSIEQRAAIGGLV